MKNVRIYQNSKGGGNIEVFENGVLIDWRNGLTKQGLKYYEMYFQAYGALGECGQLHETLTRDELIESL